MQGLVPGSSLDLKHLNAADKGHMAHLLACFPEVPASQGRSLTYQPGILSPKEKAQTRLPQSYASPLPLGHP